MSSGLVVSITVSLQVVASEAGTQERLDASMELIEP
jgi:hypothetical protein